MACSRLLGNSCGISNGKYMFAIVRDVPRHCSYTKRCKTLRKTKLIKSKNISDKKLKLATKILISISVLFVMLPYTTLFGLPFYIIGLILLWNLNLTKKLKWKWTFVPLLIVGLIYIIIALIIYTFKL